LIDGRPYHTEAFKEMAEEYHSQVINAHKAHSKVPVKLPMPEGLSAPGSALQDEVAATPVDGDEGARKDVSGNGARAGEKTRRGLFGLRRTKPDD
jgi:hypothetical protein